MRKSSSLRLTPSTSGQRPRDRVGRALCNDIAIDPTPQKLLIWLKGVQPGEVLLLVPGNERTGEPPYVKSERSTRVEMISNKPTRAMRAFVALLQRLVPVRGEVPQDVWLAAQALAALLGSRDVRHHGARHTEALCEVLSGLHQAMQAWQDRRTVDLEAPTTASEAPVQQREPVAPDVGINGLPGTVRVDLDAVRALAARASAEKRALRASASQVGLHRPAGAGPGPRLARRGVSFDLRRSKAGFLPRPENDNAD